MSLLLYRRYVDMSINWNYQIWPSADQRKHPIFGNFKQSKIDEFSREQNKQIDTHTKTLAKMKFLINVFAITYHSIPYRWPDALVGLALPLLPMNNLLHRSPAAAAVVVVDKTVTVVEVALRHYAYDVSA